MAKPDRGTVESWWREVERAWSDAWQKRRAYTDLVHRETQVNLDARLGRSVAHYQSPGLEKAEQDIADVITMRPTRFGAQPGESGQKAQDAIRDITLLSARTWSMEDRGRWIDRSIAQGQARYGYKVLRMLQRPLEDYDPDDAPSYDEWSETQPWPWYFEDVADLACGWLSRGQQHNVFVSQYEIPLLVAQNEFVVDAKTAGQSAPGMYVPSIGDDGKFGWLGQNEAGQGDRKSGMTRKLKVTVAEWLDYDNLCPICEDHHPLWAGMEIIHGSTQTAGEGEVVQEYTLPYKHAGTYRIAGGRISYLDADPHFKYRPLNFEMMVEAQVMDWAWSMMQTFANRDSIDDRVYADLSKVPDNVTHRVPDELWETMKMPVPEPGANEILASPAPLVKWPVETSQVLWDVYQEAAKKYEAAKPNRFLTGNNFEEAAQGTGTANLQGLQQSRLPFEWPTAQLDTFITQCKEDQMHAIMYWGQDEPAGTERKFFVTCTGDEQLSKGGAKAGERVYVSASKLDVDYQLLPVTESETLQEQAHRRQQAYEQMDRGYMDDTMMAEALGYYDTEDFLRRIYKYQLKKRMQPVKFQAQQAVLTTIMATVAKIDPALLGMGGPPAGAPPPGGAVPPPGGPPGAMQPPPGAVPPPDMRSRPYPGLNQPQINLPAVQGAGGGGSPLQ